MFFKRLTSGHQVDPVRIHSQTGHCVQVSYHGMDHFTCRQTGRVKEVTLSHNQY